LFFQQVRQKKKINAGRKIKSQQRIANLWAASIWLIYFRKKTLLQIRGGTNINSQSCGAENEK
jgi:hypothetical protein